MRGPILNDDHWDCAECGCSHISRYDATMCMHKNVPGPVNGTEPMTLEQFKEFCLHHDYNHVSKWPDDRFMILCKNCYDPRSVAEEITKSVLDKLDNSAEKNEDIIVTFREESGAMGSEYTGYMKGFNHGAGMLIKCKKCGNAVAIELPSY